MSWKDRVTNTVFTITTGDGKVFTPLWKSGEEINEFNATIFEYIRLDGGEVRRKRIKPRQFPLTFWFTGADNIDQSAQFKTSSKDPRSWTIRDPFYGDITGQPLKIRYNDQNLNATEVTVDFWETISGAYPTSKLSIPDDVASKFTELANVSPLNYASKVNLAPADVSQVTANTQVTDTLMSNVVTSTAYSDYQVAKNAMFAAINNMILYPIDAINAIYTVMAIPAEFKLSVSNSLLLMQAVYGNIKNILGISTVNNKAFFEAAAGACIGSVCGLVLNPQAGDYVTRNDIAIASTALTTMYSDYLTTLDNAYVSNIDPVNGFSASQQTQNGLQNMVIEVVGNLASLAFNAKQERITYLDKDSNLIVLTHTYMGLDADDNNLETFRQINNIKNRSLFSVKKGTAITYYV